MDPTGELWIGAAPISGEGQIQDSYVREVIRIVTKTPDGHADAYAAECEM